MILLDCMSTSEQLLYFQSSRSFPFFFNERQPSFVPPTSLFSIITSLISSLITTYSARQFLYFSAAIAHIHSLLASFYRISFRSRQNPLACIQTQNVSSSFAIPKFQEKTSGKTTMSSSSSDNVFDMVNFMC